MEKTLKDLIEGLFNTLDPSKDVLTESIREDMVTRFVEAVSAAVKTETVNVDEAIAKQLDEVNKQITEAKAQHEVELTELTESFEAKAAATDETYADMLEFAISQFDEASEYELTKVQEHFEKAMDVEIEDLAESIEGIIESHLESETSTETLVDMAKLKKLETAFESMQQILFKDAVLESKITESVDNMKEDYNKLLSQNIKLNKKINKIEVDSFIESNTEGMKPGLKDYLVNRFENSKLTEATELWESAKTDYKELDKENRRLAKENLDTLDLDTNLDESNITDEDEAGDELVESNNYYQNAAKQYASLI